MDSQNKQLGMEKSCAGPIHPGSILKEFYMDELKISINKLSRELKVPVSRISAILKEKRAITADTALRLSLYLGTTAEYWLRLQATYDLETLEIKEYSHLKKSILPYRAAA